MLKYSPAVFAVENEYQIFIPVEKPSLMWIEAGGKCYYDEDNGVMRSAAAVHEITVPMSVLDGAKGYTVCEKEIINRLPYFPKTAETKEYHFDFKPLPDEDIHIYHISDTHNVAQYCVSAAREYGRIDLLILNGDIPNHCGDKDNYLTIYEICDKITKGGIPVVFARGNHDLRGSYAENFGNVTPRHNGNTYYTFRLRKIWGMVLDCGEDKPDSHAEYGFTAAFTALRERETEYIEKIAKEKPFEKKGIEYRLIICHNPFTHLLEPPFDIEKERYGYWAKVLKEEIKPDVMLNGHYHFCAVYMPGDESDDLGHPCPVIIGSDPGHGDNERGKRFTGCALELKDGTITVKFTDDRGSLAEAAVLHKAR